MNQYYKVYFYLNSIIHNLYIYEQYVRTMNKDIHEI